MIEVFSIAAVAIAVATFPALFASKSKLKNPQTNEDEEKYIAISIFVFWIIYGLGIIAATIGMLMYFSPTNLSLLFASSS